MGDRSTHRLLHRPRISALIANAVILLYSARSMAVEMPLWQPRVDPDIGKWFLT